MQHFRAHPKVATLAPALLFKCMEVLITTDSAQRSTSPSASAPETPSPSKTNTPWIYSPAVDLTIGCGGWSAPLLLAGFYFANSYQRGWSVAFYFLALLTNYPHFMATVYRAYHTRDEFQKYRLYTVQVALLLAVAGVLAHLWWGLLPWIFTLYICWSPWHYTGQNFGLAMMFARRGGVAPTPNERHALRLAFVASYLLLMLSFHTGASNDPLILSLGLPAQFTLPTRAVLAVLFVGASAWALGSMGRRSDLRRIIPVATLTVTQFLWFLLPAAVELVSGLEIPQTRYSSGLLAVLHSTQYLWITSYYQKKEARAEGITDWSYWRYLITLVAGGIALFIPGPWIVSRVFHADFAASFLTFTALVNIHHFILDGKIWKLRDSRVAAVLVDGAAPASNTQTAKHSAFSQGASWFTRPSPAVRALRIGLIAVLLVWAAVDQLHYWWSSEASALPVLQRAASLNPNDSAVQVRLARAELLAGKRDEALASMHRAAQLNPASLSLQESYGRSLIEAGRDTQALAQFQAIVAKWPRNTNALVNSGMLAKRLGRDDQAVDEWQRAIAIDPSQANAQLYLAQALDQRGELQAAARHYRSYLEVAASPNLKDPPDRAAVIAALIKVADADAAINHLADAHKGFTSAANFAKQASDKTLQSLALVHLADVQEKLQDVPGALASYQLALRLDAQLTDATSAASDWFNYAQFLRRQARRENLILACLLHAESLLQAAPGEELNVIVDARQQSESRLGPASTARTQHDVEALLSESLQVK